MPLSYDLSKCYDFKWLSLLSVAENPDCQSDLEKCRNCFSQNFEIKYFDSKSERRYGYVEEVFGGKIEEFGNPDLLLDSGYG